MYGTLCFYYYKKVEGYFLKTGRIKKYKCI